MEYNDINSFITSHNNTPSSKQPAVNNQYGVKTSHFMWPSSVYQEKCDYSASFMHPGQPQQVNPYPTKALNYSFYNNQKWTNNFDPSHLNNQNVNFSCINSSTLNSNLHISCSNGLLNNEKNTAKTSKIQVKDMFSLNNSISNEPADNTLYQAQQANPLNCSLNYFASYTKGLPAQRHYQKIDYSAYKSLKPHEPESYEHKVLVNKGCEPVRIKKPHKQQIGNNDLQSSQFNGKDMNVNITNSLVGNFIPVADPAEKQISQGALKRTYCPTANFSPLSTSTGIHLANKRVKISPRRNSCTPNNNDVALNINQGKNYYTNRSVPLTNISQNFVLPPLPQFNSHNFSSNVSSEKRIDNERIITEEVVNTNFDSSKPLCNIAPKINSNYQKCHTNISSTTSDVNYYSSTNFDTNCISCEEINFNDSVEDGNSFTTHETPLPRSLTITNLQKSKVEGSRGRFKSGRNSYTTITSPNTNCSFYSNSVASKFQSENIEGIVDNSNSKPIESSFKLELKNNCVNGKGSLVNPTINKKSISIEINIDNMLIDAISDEESKKKKEIVMQEKQNSGEFLSNENQVLDKNNSMHSTKDKEKFDTQDKEKSQNSTIGTHIDDLTDTDIEQSVFFSKKPGPKSKTMTEALRAAKNRMQKFELSERNTGSSETSQKSAGNENNNIAEARDISVVTNSVSEEDKSEKKYENKINREKLDLLIEFLETDVIPVQCRRVFDAKNSSLKLIDEDNNLASSRRKLSKNLIVKNKNNTREMVSLVSHKALRGNDSSEKLGSIEIPDSSFKNKHDKIDSQVIFVSKEETKPEYNSIESETKENKNKCQLEETNCTKKLKEESDNFVADKCQSETRERSDEYSHRVQKSSNGKTQLSEKWSDIFGNKGNDNAFKNKRIVSTILNFQESQNNKCMHCQKISSNDSFWVNIVSGELRCLNCFKKMTEKFEGVGLKTQKVLNGVQCKEKQESGVSFSTKSTTNGGVKCSAKVQSSSVLVTQLYEKTKVLSQSLLSKI